MYIFTMPTFYNFYLSLIRGNGAKMCVNKRESQNIKTIRKWMKYYIRITRTHSIITKKVNEKE